MQMPLTLAVSPIQLIGEANMAVDVVAKEGRLPTIGDAAVLLSAHIRIHCSIQVSKARLSLRCPIKQTNQHFICDK